MNKSQSAGMYIVLAIVVILFVSSVFVSGPTTKVSEISYSNFLERLDKGEFKKIEKSDDFLVAIPKVQPEAKEQKTVAPTMNNPFGVPETVKAPTLKYKVLTPTYDPELMKRLDASDADIEVTNKHYSFSKDESAAKSSSRIFKQKVDHDTKNMNKKVELSMPIS